MMTVYFFRLPESIFDILSLIANVRWFRSMLSTSIIYQV
jgi:hypothetical protein